MAGMATWAQAKDLGSRVHALDIPLSLRLCLPSFSLCI